MGGVGASGYAVGCRFVHERHPAVGVASQKDRSIGNLQRRGIELGGKAAPIKRNAGRFQPHSVKVAAPTGGNKQRIDGVAGAIGQLDHDPLGSRGEGCRSVRVDGKMAGKAGQGRGIHLWVADPRDHRVHLHPDHGDTQSAQCQPHLQTDRPKTDDANAGRRLVAIKEGIRSQ